MVCLLLFSASSASCQSRGIVNHSRDVLIVSPISLENSILKYFLLYPLDKGTLGEESTSIVSGYDFNIFLKKRYLTSYSDQDKSDVLILCMLNIVLLSEFVADKLSNITFTCCLKGKMLFTCML